MKDRILKSQDIISVIISAYNSESTIEKTLCSLETQDLDKNLYEVIIMDDGSTTPRIREIVEYFIGKKSMNLYYFFQKNEWVWRARNAWISKSVGKILAFTDADCICDTDWLSTIWRNLIEEKRQFIGWYTYSDDTVIFPWKMAPVHQTGITANMAVDFTLLDWQVFDSGFTGMMGDDTDFVLRMEINDYLLKYTPDMRVLHPPNILSLKRILIRARGSHNLVWLYKKHGEKVLSSFSPIFRPIIFKRISFFTLIIFISIVILLTLLSIFWLLYFFIAISLFPVIFFLYLYKFLVVYNPDSRDISMMDRWKTLYYLFFITPLFFYYRIVGMIKFRFFML